MPTLISPIFERAGVSMKERYLEVIRIYEERFGLARAADMQKRVEEARERIWRDQEHVLQWLALRKQTETMETLLQSTYAALTAEMEEALAKEA